MDWTELLKEAPYIAALVYIVFMFLKHLKSRDAVLREISDQCHENQRQSTEAIRDNSIALGEVRLALVKMNGQVR